MMPGTDIGIQIQKLRDVHAKNFTHPRTKATSPTFGKVVVLFFADRGKVRTMLVFGKPLRACEILHIYGLNTTV